MSASAIVSPGDLPAQNAVMLERIRAVLDALGLAPEHVVKLNTWRAPPPDPAAYARAAQARFDFLAAAAPAVTGITVPALLPGGALIQADAWAVAPAAGRGRRRRLRPSEHWDWPSPTPYSQGIAVDGWVFVGGQASLDPDGRVLDAHDLPSQQARTLAYVDRVLDAAGVTRADVATGMTYHCAGTRPRIGIPSTGIAVDALAYPGQVIEIDAIAWRSHEDRT